MTQCLLIFQTTQKWFIYFQSWEITSLYFLWESWWSVLWFPSWQNTISPMYLANILTMSHLPCTCTLTPQHLYPQTKPIVPKLLPTIWEQICQKCHKARFSGVCCSLHSESLPRLSNLCWSWFQWIKSGNQRSDGYVVINDEHERILIWCLNIKVILIDVR